MVHYPALPGASSCCSWALISGGRAIVSGLQKTLMVNSKAEREGFLRSPTIVF